ncbi:hypothetical protein GP2143_05040 [marine gamma proteobacterium HTCC2143]|uniref:Uncharacterized protein n=1 Tax=marine gamma proteobacterium HTCC2143 TaxID=247633 RepID=A0YB58_9GAMM|nr:hypothetical protein GP2143_05040 [marine gamma proteobacterium HTCC2143]
MRTIFVLITVIISFNAVARLTDTTQSVTCPLKTVAESNVGLSSIIKVASEVSDEQVKKVAAALCSNLNWAKTRGKDMPPWKETMEKHLGFKGNEKAFKTFFHDFLNTHKNKILCPQYKITTLFYPPQHLFKRILAVGMNETYEEYFFNLEEGEVDFNAYEMVDGKKETVLDWVEKWIASGRGDAEELRDVAYILKDEFGAKKGIDL